MDLKTALYIPGIVVGYELEDNLEEVDRQFTADLQPATAIERAIVDSLVHTEWMIRRYRWLETEVWKTARLALPPEALTPNWPGQAWVAEPAIARIHRLRNSALKCFRETLAQLQRLQSDRRASAGEPANQPVPDPAVADPTPPRDSTAVPSQPAIVPAVSTLTASPVEPPRRPNRAATPRASCRRKRLDPRLPPRNLRAPGVSALHSHAEPSPDGARELPQKNDSILACLRAPGVSALHTNAEPSPDPAREMPQKTTRSTTSSAQISAPSASPRCIPRRTGLQPASTWYEQVKENR